jgi:putative ABC transport system ATP-binding protein
MSSAANSASQARAEPLLSLRRLSKTYGAGSTAVNALIDVDLDIAQGEFVAVMGASGSGKSTCMNVLGCLDVPTRGQYRFRGVAVERLHPDQLALLRRHWIGFVFQGFNLLPRTSAVENVEMPLLYRRVKAGERRERAMAALAAVGLEGREHHMPQQLSGGQQQRVAVARALVCEPKVVLADEPTGNLDSARSVEVMELLSSLVTRGITVVMVTHEPDMAAFAQRVITFRDGRIVSDEATSAPERASAWG